MAIPINLCVKAIKAANGIVSTAADSLGISREALHRRIQRNRKLQEALYSAREKNIDFAESKLLKQMNMDYFPAIKYFLSTQGRKRGYTLREEIEENADKYNVQLQFTMAAPVPDLKKARKGSKTKKSRR